MTKKSRELVIVVITIIAAAIGTKIGLAAFGGGGSIEKQLVKASEEINKNCPVMLDQTTRLDGTIAGPGKILVYRYTLVGLSFDDVDTSAMKAYLLPRILNNVKTSEDMKAFRENEVTMHYDYYDMNGVSVLSIRVSPEDYSL
jgi:hypothetical protein